MRINVNGNVVINDVYVQYDISSIDYNEDDKSLEMNDENNFVVGFCYLKDIDCIDIIEKDNNGDLKGNVVEIVKDGVIVW